MSGKPCLVLSRDPRVPGLAGNSGRPSAHLGVPCPPFRPQHHPGNHVRLSPATLPVKRSPPPGQGRGRGGGVGCAPREPGCPVRPPVPARLSLPGVPTGSRVVADCAVERRRALPRGARGHPRGARALGSGKKQRKREALQVTSSGGALSQEGAERPGALFPCVFGFEQSLAIGGSRAAPAPGTLAWDYFPNLPCDFFAHQEPDPGCARWAGLRRASWAWGAAAPSEARFPSSRGFERDHLKAR